MKRSTKVLGVLAILVASTLVVSAAGYLTFYGKVETEANAIQSIRLDGNVYDDEGNGYDDITITNDIDVVGGYYDEECHNLYLHWQANNPVSTVVSSTASPSGWTTIAAEVQDAGHDFSDYETPTSCDITVASDGDYSRIQLAIDNAISGNVIFVEDATYDLTSPIVVDKSITLIGNVTNPENVIINAPTTGNDRDVFQVLADDVTIEGFTIQGAEDQTPRDNGGTNSGITVGGDYYILGTKPAAATDFTFSWWGIAVSGTTIKNNIITDNSYGIFLFHAQDVLIENNKIHANTYNGDTTELWNGKGIEIYSQPSMTLASKVSSGTALPSTKNIEILRNDIYDNELFGIELNHAEGYNLGSEDKPGPFDVDVTITNNKIYNNGGEDNYPWESGIDLYRGISANGNEKNVVINDNNIDGHDGAYGHDVRNAGSDVFDATDNWWGCDGYVVSDNVNAGWNTWNDGDTVTLQPNETVDFMIQYDIPGNAIGSYTSTVEFLPAD